VAKDYLKEAREGLDKWFRLACKIAVLWWILDLLPHLPDAIANRVIDKLFGMIGL